MGLADDLKRDVAKIFSDQWDFRNGTVVPEVLKLSNEGVKLEATVLYADMADSTELVESYPAHYAAEIYKAYLHCASKIIKNFDGAITAFDGDRVMAVFIGEKKNTRAMKTGFSLNWAVREIVNPKLKAQYPDKNYGVGHGIGIDTGNLLVANTGVRGSNDLVWVGNPANYAAKLCSLRQAPFNIWITEAVYNNCEASAKTSQDGRDMWVRATWPAKNKTVYKSEWRWEL